jgi:hypothetical protein
MTGKLAYEFLAGGLWFVRSYASDFVPVPLAHLVGACIGVAFGMWPSRGAGTSASETDKLDRAWGQRLGVGL